MCCVFTCCKPGVEALQQFKPVETVCYYSRVQVTQVRRSVDVEDWSCDVETSSFVTIDSVVIFTQLREHRELTASTY